MNMRFLSVFLVLLSINILATLASDCGGVCVNNNDCLNQVCSKCTPVNSTFSICGPGAQCGGQCSVDSDCQVLDGCDLCQNNVCASNPHGCGATCTNNNDCSDPICSRCVYTSGVGLCSPGAACGQSCGVTTDCMQSGSNCTQCLGGFCYASCGLQCGNNGECDPTSCSYCQFGSSRTGLCQYPSDKKRGF